MNLHGGFTAGLGVPNKLASEVYFLQYRQVSVEVQRDGKLEKCFVFASKIRFNASYMSLSLLPVCCHTENLASPETGTFPRIITNTGVRSHKEAAFH